MRTPPEPRPVFYERTRRLAYAFAWASLGLLALELFVSTSFGTLLELYSTPRAAAAGDGWVFLHRRVDGEQEAGDRLLLVDAALKLRREPLPLADAATAMLPGDDGSVTLFFGTRFSVLRDGSTVRSGELGKKWEVQAAARDWIFGWEDGQILGRRREGDGWGEPVAVAKTKELQGLTASGGAAGAPLVAWHEKDGSVARTATLEGAAFKPGPEFPLGEAVGWDAAWSEGRIFLATWRREDRSFKHVLLRLECCPGCAAPLPPRLIELGDPSRLLGRKITGLALAARGPRLRFFLTRTSSAQSAEIGAADPAPPAGSVRLVPLADKPLALSLLGMTIPFLMIFSSFSMIFLGITLFRERGRLALAAAGALPAGPAYASLLSRLMAYLLDWTLFLPIVAILGEVLEISLLDPGDPRTQELLNILTALLFAYYFLTEWLGGGSVGKRLLGLKVTDLDGAPIGIQRSLIRNVLRLIDLGFGLPVTLIMVQRTKRHQRLGDMLAKTIVIEDR